MARSENLEMPRKGLIRQDIVSYEVNDTTGHIHINTISRTYQGEGDYIDSTSSVPLPNEIVK